MGQTEEAEVSPQPYIVHHVESALFVSWKFRGNVQLPPQLPTHGKSDDFGTENEGGKRK